MGGDRASACRARGAARARQWEEVFHLGAMLGWSPDAVIAFSEALTGRPWRACGQVELRLVLWEYRTLVRVIQAKVARRTAREADRPGKIPIGDRHAASE